MREAVFGEYGQTEMRDAHEIIAQIPDNSLTIFDKGFLSTEILLSLQQQGRLRHWLIPSKSNAQWERLSNIRTITGCE